MAYSTVLAHDIEVHLIVGALLLRGGLSSVRQAVEVGADPGQPTFLGDALQGIDQVVLLQVEIASFLASILHPV